MTGTDLADLIARIERHERDAATFAKLNRTEHARFCERQAAVLRKRLHDLTKERDNEDSV